jgi:hypothetical protein
MPSSTTRTAPDFVPATRKWVDPRPEGAVEWGFVLSGSEASLREAFEKEFAYEHDASYDSACRVELRKVLARNPLYDLALQLGQYRTAEELSTPVALAPCEAVDLVLDSYGDSLDDVRGLLEDALGV